MHSMSPEIIAHINIFDRIVSYGEPYPETLFSQAGA
jgi:hypothetical protein